MSRTLNTRRRMHACAIGASIALGALAVPRLLDAHPLHSTITELVEDGAHGTVRATIRVFADDFGTAVTHAARGRVSPKSGAAWDAAVTSYATTAFALQDAQGRPIALRPCGIRRTADLLWICLETATPQRLTALRVHDAVLCDLFEDQVNVVQGTVAGERRSLLFVRGDSYKPMR